MQQSVAFQQHFALDITKGISYNKRAAIQPNSPRAFAGPLGISDIYKLSYGLCELGIVVILTMLD